VETQRRQQWDTLHGTNEKSKMEEEYKLIDSQRTDIREGEDYVVVDQGTTSNWFCTSKRQGRII